jgi:hypothetical protein
VIIYDAVLRFPFTIIPNHSTNNKRGDSVRAAAKVNVSIPVPDPYPCPTIAPISDSFSPICAHTCFYSQGAINANAGLG